jgi:transcriptional regulator with GAF, ATPase, and Fis domain
MEAELFGCARGALSGAVQRYDGQLMAASGRNSAAGRDRRHPLETQVSCSACSNRVVSRLGERLYEVDFRLLAATNRDVRSLVEAGSSGPTSSSAWPSSRSPGTAARASRGFAELVRHFMDRFAREQGERWSAIRPEALAALSAYRGPATCRAAQRLYETLVCSAPVRRSCCRICRAES